VPLDLTSVSDQDLMEMFAKAVAWQNFVAATAVEAEILEADREAELAKLGADAVLANWEGKSTITKARLVRDSTPEVVVAQEAYRAIRARRKRAQVVQANAERIATLVSRELSRRIGRDATERRNVRWSP
jgi:hypothetical protein